MGGVPCLFASDIPEYNTDDRICAKDFQKVVDALKKLYEFSSVWEGQTGLILVVMKTSEVFFFMISLARRVQN